MEDFNSHLQGRNKSMDPMLKAVIGILVVAAGVYIGNILYTRYMIPQVGQAMQQVTTELQVNLQAQAERSRQHQLAVERERTRQKQIELDYKRQQTERHAAQQEAERLKEAAWKQFYKKPEQCENATQHDVMVECGNLYVREKRKFEQLWLQRRA
jgi:cell shape-determining protein MreC